MNASKTLSWRRLLRELTPWDMVLSVALIGGGILVPFLARSGQPATRASVVWDAQTLELSLAEDTRRVLTNDDSMAVVEVENGRIRIAASSCPHRTCVSMGWVERPGDLVACVPNRLLVQVHGSSRAPDQPDAVSR